jgi:hypothetical protein
MNRPPDDEYGSLGDLFGDFDDESPSSDAAEEPSRPAPPAPSPTQSPEARRDELPLPPGLPPEYVEAYRRGYERALRGEDAADAEDAEATIVVDRSQAVSAAARTLAAEGHEPTRPVPTAPETAPAKANGAAPGVTPVGVSGVPVGASLSGSPAPAYSSTGSTKESTDAASRGSAGEQPPMPWRSLAVLGGIALLLVLAAFGLGRLLADDPADPAAADGATSASDSSGEERPAYDGAVQAVAVTGARATCQAGSSVDAAGNPISYEPAKAHDSDLSTAWRCGGSGRGQRLTLTLPEGTSVAEVGLVPGSAKTDPVSGVARYAQNNRITKVRWRFDDGSTFVQRMNGAPGNRRMRTLRVPETQTRTVVLEILRSRSGPRNMVAVSEIRIAAPAE